MGELLNYKQWHGDTYHQVHIDPSTGKALVMQSAHRAGWSAEIFGTMAQPEATDDQKAHFWGQFQAELKAAGVTHVWGKVPKALYEKSYKAKYGFEVMDHDIDPVVGTLVIIQKQL